MTQKQLNKNIIVFIQARMGSSRLPGKVLKELSGKVILERIIDNITSDFSDIVVLTSDKVVDDEIEYFCNARNVSCFRGDEDNVFFRFKAATKKYRPDYIVRICADSPFMNGKIISRVTSQIEDKIDLVSTRFIDSTNKVHSFSAKGLSVDVINVESLLGVDENALSGVEKEHVIPVFYRKPFNHKLVKLNLDTDTNFAVDTKLDFELIEKNIESLEAFLQEHNLG